MEEFEKVPLPGSEKPAPKADAPSVAVNLVEVWPEDELTTLAEQCLDDYDEDVSSREPHMRTLKRAYELYAGIQKVKNWPFQNCANVNLPIETYSVLQIHGRIFDQLIPAKGNIFHSQATRPSDLQEVDRAERTEIFINWYLRNKVPEYRMSYDATLWQLIIFGDCFRYNYWDITKGKLCPEWIGVEDLVVNYHAKIQDPGMRGSDVRFTRVRWMSLFEIQERALNGEYDAGQVALITPERPSEAKKSEFAEAVDKIDGKNPSMLEAKGSTARQVLEQHCWIQMPESGKHEAFNGKARPVMVTIDEMSRKIVRIVLREEDDARDAKRFERETQERQKAQAALQAWQASGGMAPDPMTGQPVQVPPPPAGPEGEPEPVKKVEMSLVTHYQAFQGEGFYGLGIGHFIGPLNEAANTLVNQQIDRSTVNNAGGGMISRNLRFQRGSISRQPGEYVEVDAPPAAMKDALQNWPQVAPDPDGRWFLTYIEQMANRTTGTGDTLSGEPVGSNETARAAMARYEQAQKQISVLAARIVGYMTFDVMTIWRLFSVYLDEEEYYDCVDSMGQPRPNVKIGRADFIPDARVTPTADARVSSRAERIGAATEFLQMVTNPQAPPELSQNPAIRRAAIERWMYANDLHEMIPMLGPPPGPPQPPPPIPQYEENAKFLKDQDHPVNEQDDDDAHLIDMQQFRTDPLGYEKMSATGRKMFDNHERGHFAQKLLKGRKADEQRRQQAAQLLGPPGGGPPGLAPAPGNGAPPPFPPS